VLSTAFGGLAINYTTLIGARILAGLFSGPAVSLSYALLTDYVPEERRGRALGMVGSVWSLAGIVGLPIGLKLAEWGSWRTPFFTIAGLGVVLIPMVLAAVKREAATRKKDDPVTEVETLLQRSDKKSVALAFFLNFIRIAGNFLLVPNIAAYLQLNLNYPRDHLSWLYFTGGLVTFFTVRLAGRLTDRLGASAMIVLATIGVIATYYGLFINYSPIFPIIVLFVSSGIFNSARYTIISTESSKVPPPAQRAGFMSLISAAQALGQSLGAFVSSLILFDPGMGPLQNMAEIAWIATAIAACGPFMVIWLTRLNKRRAAGFAPMPEALI
jgi:predicted MFS family arabinose efflux permease